MNRGAGKADVFHSGRDARRFLRLLEDGSEQTGVEVHAYCLMGNHYHLLLHCPAGGLSSFMHRLGSMYTRYLNHRLGSDGPIFRGRFNSLWVDTTEYLLCAARYIHQNPLDIRPGQPLTSYPWSSYANYLGGRPAPPWLHTDVLLDAHGGPDEMRDFVEGDAGAVAAPIDWAIDMAIATSVHDRLVGVPHIRRTIALNLVDRADGGLRAAIEEWLAFPSADARRVALARARKRVLATPELADVGDAAFELLK